MLDALKFVKGAVARKDPVPVLTHFSIHNGRIRGYNGLICLSAPMPLAIDCQPKAAPFTKAIEICEGLEETPAMALTKAGKLTVSSGKFRVHIDCSPDEFPTMEPEGQTLPLPDNFMDAIRTLAPLVAEDASRPWARGILFREGSAFATNNVVIGQFWVGVNLPFDVNIPDECIKELIRVKQSPVSVQATDRSITFHFANDRWIKSQLLTTSWPQINVVLDHPSDPTPIPQDFFAILERLAPYADMARRVHLCGDSLTTHLAEGEGASMVCSGLGTTATGSYNVDLLRSLSGLVASIDFSRYPKPALFFGPNTDAGYPVFRGAIVGMKSNAL